MEAFSDQELVDKLIHLCLPEEVEMEEGIFSQFVSLRGEILARLANCKRPFNPGNLVKAKLDTRSYENAMNQGLCVNVHKGEELEVAKIWFDPAVGWLFEAAGWKEIGWMPLDCNDFSLIKKRKKIL